MGEDKKLPYKAAGERLRTRREALQKEGTIGRLKEMVTKIPVTVSSYLSYERGEYWPKGAKRKELAKIMGWSEIELDHGPQHAAPSIESPEISRLIMAFGWLTKQEKRDVLADLESKAVANKAFAKELGVQFEFKSDKDMLDHLMRGGDFPPGSKKISPAKRRGQSFKEEDPE